MKSRKILFSLIALMLITLCGMYLGFFFTAKDYNVGAEQEKDQDFTDLEPDEDEEPDHDDNDDGGDSDIQIPTDSLELIKYGLNIYQNGAGSQANYSYSLFGKAAAYGQKADSTQYIKGRMTYSGGKSLDEAFWSYEHNATNAFIASYGRLKEECRVMYTEKEKDYVAVGSTKNMNLTNLTYQFDKTNWRAEYNYKDATEAYKVFWADGFPYQINKNTVKVTRHDSRSSKYYTKITVSCDVNKLPDTFRDYYFRNNGMIRVNYTNYEFTFIISKKTGKIKKIIRSEDFWCRVIDAGYDVTIYCKTNCTQDFVVMDKAINIIKPF